MNKSTFVAGLCAALFTGAVGGCSTDSLRDFDLCGIFDCKAESQFQEVADSLGGEFRSVNDSTSAGKIVLNILDSNVTAGADVAFLIDRTGSMSDDIKSVKKVVAQIVTLLNRQPNVRLAMGFYQDRHVDGQGWYTMIPLSLDYGPAQTALAGVKVDGGGDSPESLFDAMAKAMDDLDWNPASKILLIVIGDAPSHTGGKTSHSLSDLKAKAATLGVSFTVFTILSSPL
jgi:hypothetical protein